MNWLLAIISSIIIYIIANKTNNPTEFIVIMTLYCAMWNNFELRDIRQKIKTTED